MVLTRSRQRKNFKATDDKPQISSTKDDDLVAQNASLKTREAKPPKSNSEHTSSSTANEVKPQPDSTDSLPVPQDTGGGNDAVVIATTEEEPLKTKSRKKRNRKRKSVDGEIKSPKTERQNEVEQDAPTNTKKGETLSTDAATKSRKRRNRKRKSADGEIKSPKNERQNEVEQDAPKNTKKEETLTDAAAHSVSSSSSSPSVKQKSNNNTSSKNETVSCKRAKKDERTAVDQDLQKENVSSTLENGEPLTGEKTEVVKAKDIMKLYKKESFLGEVTKHKGNPKSGRKWKTEQTSRSSGMKQDKPMKTSWKRKMDQKAERKSMKLFEAELKEAKSKELEKKKQHRANKIKLKLENERKSEVVQVIKNTSKLKRMKKKQLRKVEMRKIPNFNTAQIFA